jgi:putative serine protease PepD
MDEQNQYPHDSQGEPVDNGQPQTPASPASGPETGADSGTDSSTDSSTADTSQSWFGDYGQPSGQQGAEQTRPIPSYQPQQQPPPPWGSGYPLPPAPSKTSRGRGLTAAVLAGALVLGGAAGVGGSAIFHAFNDDSSTGTTSDSSGPFQATKTATVQDGTVEKVAQSVLPSVVKVNVTSSSGAGSGSGIILSKDGKILTNNHVVTGAGDNGTITVNFNDGTTKRAKVIGTDPVTDVAVIQAEGASDLTPAALGSSGSLKVGQTVVAVGSPYGLNATVTTGIVSALNRPVSVSSAPESEQSSPFGDPEQQQPQQQGQDLSTTYPAIQTDAAINPGNSGGPLVDMSGRVVGINSSIRTASDTSDQGGSIGLGFSIPIDEVLPIVNQITDNQDPTHARLGVSVSDVSGNTLTQGAQLRSIENGGAADKAGLKVGDVITKVDDEVIDGSESLVATIRGHRPGNSVQITYLRDGKSHTVSTDLGSDANTKDS